MLTDAELIVGVRPVLTLSDTLAPSSVYGEPTAIVCVEEPLRVIIGA